jgi:hypothetical protein
MRTSLGLLRPAQGRLVIRSSRSVRRILPLPDVVEHASPEADVLPGSEVNLHRLPLLRQRRDRLSPVPSLLAHPVNVF